MSPLPSVVVQMLYRCFVFAGLVFLTDHADCGDYKSTPTQCLLNVGPASPVLANIYSVLSVLHAAGTCMLAVWARCFEQSWVNVGTLSVMLGHSERGAKHDSVTQYWANIGSAS